MKGTSPTKVRTYDVKIDFEQIRRELQTTPSARHYWTPEEDAILKEFYPIRTSRLIAEKLKRTNQAIENRAHRLGIMKNNMRQLKTVEV